ncbi:MAG: GumC family protein [Myxococcaceae bacterium]
MDTRVTLPTAPSPETYWDLRAWSRILYRSRWWIAACAVLGILISAAATLRQPRVYEASTTLIIDIAAPRVLDSQQVQDVMESGVGTYWYSKEYYETQYKIISSRTVADRVAQQLGLANDADFLGLSKITDTRERDQRMKSADAAQLLQRRLRVEPVKDSRVVKLTVEDGDPDRAARLADAFATAYIEHSLTVRQSTNKNASTWLQDQLDDLETALNTSGREFFDFKRKHDIVSTSWEDKQQMVRQQLTSLTETLNKKRTDKAELKARHDAIVEAKRLVDQELALASLPPVMSSPAVQQLKFRYAQLREECADLEDRYLESHPKLTSCRERLIKTKESLSSEMQTSLNAALAQYREVVETEKNLEALFQKAKSEAFELNQFEPEFTEIRRRHENNQRLYDVVLKRLKDTGLSGLLHMSNVRVLDPARVKRTPVRPVVRNNLFLGLALGLAFGTLAAFVRDLLDNTVASQEDVEGALGLTFLGILPTGTSPAGGAMQDLAVFREPRSPLAECCRSVRTNLLFMSPDRPLKTVLVTSGSPRDGKTTVAISLAIAMAESGARVLLIDSDMRRPRLHQAFGVPNTAGLASLIVGDADLDATLRSTEVPHLSVLTCGPLPPNPAELLHTQAFKQLLERCTQKFDRVIIDSPPLGAVADGAVIAAQVDGTVLVVRANRTHRDLVRRSIRTLGDVKARILGVVLNDLDLKNPRYPGIASYLHYGYYGNSKNERTV